MDHINDQFIEFDTVEETMALLDAQKRIVTLMEHFYSEPVWSIDPEHWGLWPSYDDISMVNGNGWKRVFSNVHWGIPRFNDPFYLKFEKFTGNHWSAKFMDGKNLIIDCLGNVCTIVWDEPATTSEEALRRFTKNGDPFGPLRYRWFNWEEIAEEAQKAGNDPMAEFLRRIDFHRTQIVNYLDVFVKSYEKFTKNLETMLSGLSFISNKT